MNAEKQKARELARKLLPPEFLAALKKLGFGTARVIAFFANYHLQSGFFTDAEDWLKRNNRYKLSRPEFYAIWGYTTRLFYSELNEELRNGKFNAKTMDISRMIISGLKKMPQHSGPAYRAFVMKDPLLLPFLKKREKGKTVISWQFISAGSQAKAALRGKPGRNIVEYYEKLNSSDISEIADGIRYRDYPPLELLAFPPKSFKALEKIFDNTEKIYYIRFRENN